MGGMGIWNVHGIVGNINKGMMEEGCKAVLCVQKWKLEGMGMGLLLLLFSNFLFLSSSSPLLKALPTAQNTTARVLDVRQENRGMDEGNRGSHARPEMKINAGGVGGSHPHGNGENGDHGTLGGGGAAFIPLYAAGAANSHHPNQHHSSSDGCSKWDRLHAFGAATSTATLVLCMYT